MKMIMLANSLVDGFIQSNMIGRGIVCVQLILSVAMVAVIIGKWRELDFVASATRRFLHDFSSGLEVLEYYLNRRPSAVSGLERIYKETCERLLKLLAPDVRTLLVGRSTNGDGAAALTAREVELVRGTCEHALDEEIISVERSMGIIATVVGLIIAIPGVCAFNYMNGRIRNLTSDMEGFADELMGRVACEFQGRGA